MFIVRPDVEEADLDKLIEGFSANITSGGGEVKSVEKMGRRRLAYTVRKFNDGFYVLLTVARAGQPDRRDRAPPARLRAGDQVHHRAHGRGREASGEGEGPARLQGEAQRAAHCAAARAGRHLRRRSVRAGRSCRSSRRRRTGSGCRRRARRRSGLTAAARSSDFAHAANCRSSAQTKR